MSYLTSTYHEMGSKHISLNNDNNKNNNIIIMMSPNYYNL